MQWWQWEMVIYGAMSDDQRSIYENNIRTIGLNFYIKRKYNRKGCICNREVLYRIYISFTCMTSESEVREEHV